MGVVIAGAKFMYGDEEIIIPHYSGDFTLVDCSRYMRLEDLKNEYDQEYIDSVIENEDFIEYDDETYYYAEYSPINVNDNWELIDDISDLRFHY